MFAIVSHFFLATIICNLLFSQDSNFCSHSCSKKVVLYMYPILTACQLFCRIFWCRSFLLLMKITHTPVSFTFSDLFAYQLLSSFPLKDLNQFSNIILSCSRSQTIKVAISWEAMIKLVHWFYSNELPNPPSGCLWDNMEDEEKLLNLEPYVELYWLSEFWILENIQEACWNVIVSCLDSAKQLSIKILKMSGNLCLWKLADVAANHVAPSYRQLLDSCELEELDDVLVHLIYSASTQLTQDGGNCFR